MIRRSALATGFALFTILASTGSGSGPVRQTPSRPTAGPQLARGATATRLADGRILIVGGEGTEASTWLWDPQTGAPAPTANSIAAPRAWHSATVLSDGNVLLIGGRSGDVLVGAPEIFDPATGVFSALPHAGAVPRASHSATLLTDGRVLVAGGSDEHGNALPTEIWDPAAQTVTSVAGSVLDRRSHTATVTGDGRVAIAGGETLDGLADAAPILIDPDSGTVQSMEPPATTTAPAVRYLFPGAGAKDVPVDAHVTIRFSDAMNVASISTETVSLNGPDGSVPLRLVPAEGSRLLFAWPTEPLKEETRYVLQVRGVIDEGGLTVAPMSATFTTAGAKDSSAQPDGEEWIPDASAAERGWRTNRPASPWEQLPALVAPPGVTAVSGRVLTLDGRPLAEVTLEIDGVGETESDRTGRFLLLASTATGGRHVLDIEGATASRAGRQYGFFEYGMTIETGQTNVLPFTIWMPRLDTRHTVKIPSPTTSEVVVTTPYIPGLELHIPPQTVIRGEDGKPVTEVGITAIPVDRPPFPLAKNVDVPVYFTIQPGGAYVYTRGTGPKGAWLVYPNYQKAATGVIANFWHYDPEDLGWYVYGSGTVRGSQVFPESRTRLYEFTGAMIDTTNTPAGTAPPPWWWPFGDPVDPATGIFVLEKTDLYLPDVIPLTLQRTYRPDDLVTRSFGKGATQAYDLRLWSAHNYTELDLILPDSGRVHYVRTSPGTGFVDAVFEHTVTPTRFFKSTVAWNGNGWNLTLKDGTVYVFGDVAPLQAIRDHFGNTVTVTHANGQSGNVTRVTSPNGRWIAFTYDTSNRVTQAIDNIGRTVAYTYDTNGNLSTVTDPENNVTTYTYGATTPYRLLTIRDGRNIVYLTNTYTNGRVTQQTLADPNATYTFAYTTDGNGNVTQTDITDPRGHVERLTFNADHYVTSDTEAYGTTLARTTTTTRASGSNLVTAVVDSLNRRTECTYDTSGHVLTRTRLASTQDAVTTTFTYEPMFFQLASVTDPLNHTWTMTYDSAGRVSGVTDPLDHETAVAMNAAGQVTQITDALQHAWELGYTGGDLTSVADPMANVWRRFVDAAGRPRSGTDALGRVTRVVLDKLNRPTLVTDPIGEQTTFSYDANSRLLSLTDALSHATTYTYDNFDRLATRTDPLTQAASYTYDFKDQLTQVSDRKGQVTNYAYDALDRLTQVTYNDQSTITYTYDAGDRMTQISDSTNGTITRQYDALNRLTQETTPEGTLNYTYDADGARTTMTVAGQSAVTYSYDHAHRLTSITQGSSTVSLTYDDANRRSTVTYPNGIVGTYGYDAANQVTSITYALGQSTLGDLTYTYDAAGNRTSGGGSWARTGLPAALGSATYDAANRIATWGGTAFTYDLNGNLTGDGTNTYIWSARNELTAIGGGATANFAYDATGRRRSKTIAATTTKFLYDALNFVQEQSSGGAPNGNLLTGLNIDETFTRTDATGAHALLVDSLGSALELANSSGALQTHYTSEPFGATTASGTADLNTQQFTSRESDATGLYYYRSRFYSPALQRFLSEDSIEFSAGDPNLYAYTFNAPTRYTDPSGRFVIPLILCAGGAAGSALGDAMGGRKFNPYKAAAWCAIGLGAGFLAPAIGAAAGYGAGYGATAAAAAGAAANAATRAAQSGIDPNKLNHIFNNPDHGLGPLVETFGSWEAAGGALQQGAQAAVNASGQTGRFVQTVDVGGVSVTVKGIVIDGVARIGTAFVPR
jgi:RHS repeat-associated protein